MPSPPFSFSCFADFVYFTLFRKRLGLEKLRSKRRDIFKFLSQQSHFSLLISQAREDRSGTRDTTPGDHRNLLPSVTSVQFTTELLRRVLHLRFHMSALQSTGQITAQNALPSLTLTDADVRPAAKRAVLTAPDPLSCLLQLIQAKTSLNITDSQRRQTADILDSMISSQGGLSTLASKLARSA